MPHFVELWIYLSDTPLFGLTVTLAVYVLTSMVYARCNNSPWANPVMWSVIVLGATLIITRVQYETYFSGAQFIHFLLGPAVVALAWPLWLRRAELKARGGRLVLAALLGGGAAAVSAVVLAWAVGLPTEVLLSLVPKSVTAPVGMGIADKIHGDPALTAVFAVLTGLVGGVSGKMVFRLVRVPASGAGWAARGFAMGTAAHGIGAALAIQADDDAGAYAGLALGLQAILAAIIMPPLLG